MENNALVQTKSVFSVIKYLFVGSIDHFFSKQQTKELLLLILFQETIKQYPRISPLPPWTSIPVKFSEGITTIINLRGMIQKRPPSNFHKVLPFIWYMGKKYIISKAS